MNKYIVVNQPEKWNFSIENISVISSQEYLTNPKFSLFKKARIFNLCKDYSYQSKGYYVSLLAEARGHLAIPTVKNIVDLRALKLVRIVSEEFDDVIQQSLKNIKSREFTLSIYFGQNVAQKYKELSSLFYKHFQVPFLRVKFNHSTKWNIQSIKAISESEIPDEHLDSVHEFANQYFSKKRYRDSANAYRQYVLDNPLSDGAPLFSGYIIDVYEKGNFPSLLIPAKEEYVNNYGIDSEFWRSKPQPVRDALSKNLKVYLEELAKYEHNTGQRLVKDSRSRKNNNVAVADPKASFLRAAAWYDQFIRTFPDDEKTADIYFLMAEALNDAGDFERAFNTYRLLAYQYSLPASQQAKGAEAGYSAIVLAQKLEAQASVVNAKQVNAQQVNVQQGTPQSANSDQNESAGCPPIKILGVISLKRRTGLPVIVRRMVSVPAHSVILSPCVDN